MTHDRDVYPHLLRGANIQTLHTTALEARRSFVDVVSPQVSFAQAGDIFLPDVDGPVVPTRTANTQLAKLADIPTKFYDRIHTKHGALWQHTMSELFPGGSHLFRTMPGILRSVNSDRYQVIDNVDVLTQMLTAFTAAGLGPNELTIDGDFDAPGGLLRIRCSVPSIQVEAMELVKNYKDPYSGRTGRDEPMIFAGIEVSNSETGGGAFCIRPRAVVLVCKNGLTRDIKSEQFRQIHLGSKLEEGVIKWSEDTRRKQLELVASAAEDAIRTFISPEYLRKTVDEASEAAGIPIKNMDKAKAALVKTASLSDTEANDAMLAFMRSGDATVLGLAQAVTAIAQHVEDSERQSELERTFWQIVGAPDQFVGAR